MKIDNLEKLFKSVYNKNLQRFTEINKDNFGAKIDANKSGASYAQAQNVLQRFFTDLANELQRGGVIISLLNLVDYNVIAA